MRVKSYPSGEKKRGQTHSHPISRPSGGQYRQTVRVAWILNHASIGLDRIADVIAIKNGGGVAEH